MSACVREYDEYVSQKQELEIDETQSIICIDLCCERKIIETVDIFVDFDEVDEIDEMLCANDIALQLEQTYIDEIDESDEIEQK